MATQFGGSGEILGYADATFTIAADAVPEPGAWGVIFRRDAGAARLRRRVRA